MTNQSRIHWWFSLIIGLCICFTTSAEEVQLACLAEYNLFLNGKKIGSLRSELKPLHQDHWHYTVDTKARRGLIKASIKQRSEFVRHGDEIRPLMFSSKQKIAIAKRESTASYDWDTMSASGRHKKKDWRIDFEPGFVDRLTLNERMRLDLRNDPQREVFDYVRLDRGKLRPMTFVREQVMDSITVPAGRFDTIKLSRQHDKSDRRTTSWHSPELSYFPVRMEQLDDGDLTATELTKLVGCTESI